MMLNIRFITVVSLLLACLSGQATATPTFTSLQGQVESEDNNDKHKKAQAKQTKPESKTELDWGDWNKKFEPQQRYGVGIKGKLQSAISAMDKSNLINDNKGVKVTPSKTNSKAPPKLDIKKMKEEIKALEKKVEQEIDNDIDL